MLNMSAGWFCGDKQDANNQGLRSHPHDCHSQAWGLQEISSVATQGMMVCISKQDAENLHEVAGAVQTAVSSGCSRH